MPNYHILVRLSFSADDPHEAVDRAHKMLEERLDPRTQLLQCIDDDTGERWFWDTSQPVGSRLYRIDWVDLEQYHALLHQL